VPPAVLLGHVWLLERQWERLRQGGVQVRINNDQSRTLGGSAGQHPAQPGHQPQALVELLQLQLQALVVVGTLLLF
jgi:hypothetical protein